MEPFLAILHYQQQQTCLLVTVLQLIKLMCGMSPLLVGMVIASYKTLPFKHRKDWHKVPCCFVFFADVLHLYAVAEPLSD